MYRPLLPLCLLLGGLALLAGGAPADQNDARLDSLFARLHLTDDAAEGERITRQIWEIWYEVEEADIEEPFARGVVYMRLGRHDDALDAFNHVVEQAPRFAEGWNRRATLLYLMGDLQSSVDDIKHTLALEPRHFGALSGLGLIYMRGEQWDDALRAFRKALEINPHLPGAKQNIEIIEQQARESTI